MMYIDKLALSLPLWGIIAMGAIACRRLYLQPSFQARRLLHVLIAGMGWSLCYSLEILSPNSQWAFLWSRISYFFIASLPAFWLIFATSLAGERHLLSNITITILFLPAVVTLIAIWTNDYHHLFWQEVTFDSRNGLLLFDADYGPIFHAFQIYAQTLCLCGFLYVLFVSISSKVLTTGERILLCLMPALPMLANVVYTMDLAPVVYRNIDFTPFSFLIATGSLAFGNFRQRISSLVLLARNRILENLPDATFVTDEDGTILDLNTPAKELLGELSPESEIKRPIFDIMPGLEKIDENSLSRTISFSKLTNFPGQTRTFRVQQNVIFDKAGGSIARLLVFGDISQLKSAENRARTLAYYDQLTRLPNRHYFQENLHRTIKRAERTKTSLAVFLLDLDGFKDINDSLGHDQGDVYMGEIANRLAKVTRESEFAARLGGDEFCLIAEGINGPSEAEFLVLRCVETISQPIHLLEHEIHPRVSIGIAFFPDDGDSVQSLLTAADSAMYKAKRSGGDGFAFYHSDMTLELKARLLLDQQMRRAVKEKQFKAVFQPIVHVESGECVCVEVLARWRSPDGRDVSAVEFIPALERLGLVNALGDLMLEMALEQAVQWREQQVPTIGLHINIAASQLADRSLIDTLSTLLQRSGIDPSLITLEVTETSIQTTKDHLATLREIKQFGVKIALDDFGTGYSSLASLKHLPVDTLKIDRSLISDLENSDEDRILIETLCKLGHQLGFQVVAEGVETNAQLEIIRKMDCDLIQGFLYSRPLEAAQVAEFVMSRQRMEDKSLSLLN